MSNRLSEEKAKLIAVEYCTNGFEKVKALLAAGYKQSYASSGTGLKLYENVRLKDQIAKIQAQTAIKQQITLDWIQSEHQKQYEKLAEQDHSVAFQHLQAAGKTIAAYADVQLNPAADLAIDNARRNYLKSISSKTLSSTLLEDIHDVQGQGQTEAGEQVSSPALPGQ
jgi:hypothetical protein